MHSLGSISAIDSEKNIFLYFPHMVLIIGRSSVFYADRKSKMAATTGHSINTGPYGENTEIYSSLNLLHWLNLNCASIIGRSFTNFYRLDGPAIQEPNLEIDD
jgi:hypothetical protein